MVDGSWGQSRSIKIRAPKILIKVLFSHILIGKIEKLPTFLINTQRSSINLLPVLSSNFIKCTETFTKALGETILKFRHRVFANCQPGTTKFRLKSTLQCKVYTKNFEDCKLNFSTHSFRPIYNGHWSLPEFICFLFFWNFHGECFIRTL